MKKLKASQTNSVVKINLFANSTEMVNAGTTKIAVSAIQKSVTNLELMV